MYGRCGTFLPCKVGDRIMPFRKFLAPAGSTPHHHLVPREAKLQSGGCPASRCLLNSGQDIGLFSCLCHLSVVHYCLAHGTFQSLSAGSCHPPARTGPNASLGNRWICRKQLQQTGVRHCLGVLPSGQLSIRAGFLGAEKARQMLP